MENITLSKISKKCCIVRWIVLSVLMICASLSIAQIPLGVEVNVFPPYPTQYNVWIANQSNYMVTIQNPTDTEFEYYIRAGIEGDAGGEETFARISPSFFPIESLTIGPGEISTLTSFELEDLYRNATESDLERSSNLPLDINGELPEGTYQLCFEVMSYNSQQEIFLSPKICSDPFTVSHNSLQLVYPLDESVWDATGVPVTFQWMNHSSQVLSGDFEYHLEIYELSAEQLANESIYEYVESGGAIFYETDPTPDLNYIYDEDFGLPQFTEGKLYAARVKLIDGNGDAFFDGAGYSNINTFWFGYNPTDDDDSGGDDEITDCFERCQIPPLTNTTVMNSYSDIVSFRMGHFLIDDVILADVTEGLQSISGIGIVNLDFLNDVKIEVEFSGITLNTEGKALSGEVKGMVDDPNRNIVDIVGGIIDNFQPLNQDDLSSLSDVCSNLLLVNKIRNGAEVTLPFGISQEIGGQAFTFALVDFTATPQNAEMDFVNMLDFSSLGDGFLLGVGASNVCVAPDGFGNEFMIHLLDDVNIPLDGDLTVEFKGGLFDPGTNYDLKENQSPCYFEMSCNGFKSVNISGIVDFPQTMLKKEIEGVMIEEENAKGYFSSTYERDFSEISITNDPIPRSDFIVDLAMDDFQLTKLKGWGFTVANASLDLSESRNPQFLEFPEGYDNEYTVDEEWKGFYIKDATLRTPKDYAEDGIVGTADVNHILIDNSLSLDIEAYEMLNREDGVFKGWSLGIDTFELKILQNTLQHGHIDGKFGAPVMEPQEYLDFYAIVDEVTNDPEETFYTFDGMIRPSENLDIPLAIASASVCQSSYLAMKLSPIPEDRLVEVFLKGDLDVNTGQFGTAVSGNAYMELADYQLHYNSVDGFVMPDEVADGRGSYFGMENNDSIDCSSLDYTELQEAFDYMMDRMIENTEGVFRTIAEETDLDVEEEGGGTWRDGDQMNGLPIRFKKSRFLVNQGGAPQLDLIVEAQLSAETVMEAGLIITSQKIEEGKKFRFGNPNIETYFTEGSIVLNQPVNNSSLATNEPITVKWTANFQDASVRDRLEYDIKIIELTQQDNLSMLDSIFRVRTVFFHEVENVVDSQYQIVLNSVAPSFTSGKSYAIRLLANDPSPDAEVLNNDGYSNINIFTWGQTAIVGTNDGNNSPCAARCSPALPTDTTYHSNPTSVTSFTMGNFEIEIDGTPTQSGNLISGDGVAKFDGFLNDVRISVSFVDVGLNPLAEAMQGSVKGKAADQNLVDQVGDYISGNTSSDVIGTLTEFLDEARMITDVMTTGQVDLPFGIDVNMSTNDGSGESNSVNIAFTDFELTPTTSDIDFLFMLSLPSLGQGFNFGLGAQNICIAPDGFGSEARLFMPDDLDIPIDGEVELKFNGGLQEIVNGQDTIQPFYLEIDCNGFKVLNISGTVEFPRDMLLKEDPNTGQVMLGEKVNGYFGMNLTTSGGDAYVSDPGEARTDLLLNFTMDAFQLKGLDGWGFEVTNAVLDLSEAANMNGMVFPTNYDFEDLPDPEFWTGFYLKSLKFKPPNAYTEQDDGTLGGTYYTIENLLIDPQFSAVFTAEDLLSYANGNIKGWGVSIDSFGLSILQNTFQSGGMGGQVGAPVLDEEDRLTYIAAIDQQVQEDDEDASYLFRAVVRPPANGIKIPMLVADATVCPSSYLGIQLGKGEDDTQMELFLKSTLSIDFDESTQEIAGDFKLALADFQVQYNTVKGFVMESESGQGKGTTIGLGLGTSDACSSTPYLPDFDALVADYQDSGGSDTDRDVVGDDPESGDGSSNTASTDDEGNATGEGIGEEDATESAMNGFPIRLGDFGISMSDGNPVVSFAVDLALASGGQGFAAGAGLTIYTKKENVDGKDKIKFDSVGYDCARLAVDFDFLEILGCMCHESTTTASGTTEGYFGRVIMNAMDQIAVDLQGGFATFQAPDAVNYGNEDYHGFWYIDGTFSSNTGIPLGPMRLNALGGGMYWNMNPPPLPGHDDIDEAVPNEGGAQEVNDCIASLADQYNIDVQNGGAPLGASPQHIPGTPDDGGTYGLRTIKFNAGLSFADPKLVILDPLVSVTWEANQGINEITVGGYLYLLQEGYMARGAPSSPPQNDPKKPNAEGLAFPARGTQGQDGSKIWMTAFNTLYFDRRTQPGNTLTAFKGTGSMYLNIIPGMFYGSADEDDRYKMISHDIFIGHVNHEETRRNNYTVGGNSNTYWHAYLGNPYTSMGRGQLSFNLAGAATGDSQEPTGDEAAGVEVTGYMMMGHGIPTSLPEPPRFIIDILEGRESSSGEEEDSSYSGDPVSLSDGGREELSDKTSGFALGATVGVNASFDKIIYANLEVVLGMDLLFMNVAGMQCTAQDGDTYAPPGVSNFYGMGQIFAGLKGKVGVKGKILGKEIDVEFLNLAAAMLIQAGGPNPFWIDGKARVSYSVLGGMIKGDARVEVQVGDKCYPYNADPFALDVISKVFPNSLQHTDDSPVSPRAHPTMTFKMPVTFPDEEEAAKLSVPEVDDQGNRTMRIVAPTLENFKLYRVYGTVSDQLAEGDIEFSESRRTASIIPESRMSDSDQQVGNRIYRIDATIKAKEKIDGVWDYISDFQIDTSETFFVAPLSTYEEDVTYTNPIRGQRFFMPEEWNGTQHNITGGYNLVGYKRGLIRFYRDISTSKLYEYDINNNQCFYDIVWRNATDGEEVSRYTLLRTNSTLESDISFKKIKFPIPSLDPNTTYLMQLVRRKIITDGTPLLTGEMQADDTVEMSEDITEEFDVDNEYTIQYPEDDENTYRDVELNESLIHVVVFKTSKYATLADKLANVVIDVNPAGTSALGPGGEPVGYSDQDQVLIPPADEQWEEAEMIGHTEVLNFSGGIGDLTHSFTTPARVVIIDPLEGQYFDDLVKPKMNTLIDRIRLKIDNKVVGLNNILTSVTNKLQFPESDYNYINTLDYSQNNFNTYGKTSVLLNNYYESISFFVPAIAQGSSESFLNNAKFMGVWNTYTDEVNSNVILNYNLRYTVRQDIEDIVEWTEVALDMIKNGFNGTIIQTWNANTVNSHFASTFEAYNDLVSSSIYYGNASTFDYGQTEEEDLFENPYDGFGSFTASNLHFYYNTRDVDIEDSTLQYYGSKVIKVIDD